MYGSSSQKGAIMNKQLDNLVVFFDTVPLPDRIAMPRPIILVRDPATFVHQNLASLKTYWGKRIARAHLERLKLVIEQMGYDFKTVLGEK